MADNFRVKPAAPAGDTGKAAHFHKGEFAHSAGVECIFKSVVLGKAADHIADGKDLACLFGGGNHGFALFHAGGERFFHHDMTAAFKGGDHGAAVEAGGEGDNGDIGSAVLCNKFLPAWVWPMKPNPIIAAFKFMTLPLF